VRLRKIIVYDLDDFICRCGTPGLGPVSTLESGKNSTRLRCGNCGRIYMVQKKEKKTRISNLPMSFGSRSLHWNNITADSSGLNGIIETFYEIKELPKEKNPA